MKIEYRDNRKLPPGNGFLVFSEELPPDGPWTLSIQRSSDQKYLSGKSSGQWLGETIRIPFQNADFANGSLKLAIGPAIVDSLDQKDQYRLDLRGADNIEHRGRLKISAIAHSMGNSLDNTAKMAEKPAPPPPPAPEPPSARPVPAAAPAPEEPLHMPSEQASTQGSARRLALPLLALLALLCLAWWYFDKRPAKQEATAPAASEESAAAGSASEGMEVIGRKAPEPQASKTGALPDAERAVREFFAGSNLAPVNALALARSLPHNTPAEQDAIYRLYYYAVTSENPAGYMEYARCLDPSAPQWGTIEKNGAEAWQYYEKAAAGKDAAATSALENLHKWLEEQAQAGDAMARAWLGSISK